MRNIILVSAATAFITTCLVLFTVAMLKENECKDHCGKGQETHCKKGSSNCHKGNDSCGSGGCDKTKNKDCKSMCSPNHGEEEYVEIEKKVVIKTLEEEVSE